MAISEAQRNLSHHLSAVAECIDELILAASGEKMGFSLVIWNRIDGGQAQYISNCARPECIKGLKLLLKQWQALEEISEPEVPLHEKKGDI